MTGDPFFHYTNQAVLFRGLDSAFSLVEAVTTAVKDSRNFKGFSHVAVTGMVTLVALLISVLYSYDGGLFALDVVDYYVNNILMVSFTYVARGCCHQMEHLRRLIGLYIGVRWPNGMHSRGLGIRR